MFKIEITPLNGSSFTVYNSFYEQKKEISKNIQNKTIDNVQNSQTLKFIFKAKI